jgi:hypothetical protein
MFSQFCDVALTIDDQRAIIRMIARTTVPTRPARKRARRAGVFRMISPAGEYITNTIEVPLAKPNDPQAYGSALMYG